MSLEDVSFAYREPDTTTLLILAAFLLLLNITNFVLDKLVYCGLLGQILIGVWFGSPGAQWLNKNVELVVQQLGYLGLVLLVYEGGLSSNVNTLKANLLLSCLVAITGIAVPISLSFVLQKLMSINSLQAFAAGAALCSTSLGTTFTVLMTSGLVESRLGVVLTSAAMMDDVVGLVMVHVISSLGTSGGDVNASIIVRPVFVSLAFAAITPIIFIYIISPLTRMLWSNALLQEGSRKCWYLRSKQTHFLFQTLFLIAMVASASYAGTSGLFAAYLAGVVVSWFDKIVECNRSSTRQTHQETMATSAPADHHDNSVSQASHPDSSQDSRSNTDPPEAITLDEVADQDIGPKSISRSIYEKYYQGSVNAILKPFFFASIGFSIPITRMFTGGIIWRGLVYTVLMVLGKLVCGIWLLRLPNPFAQFDQALKAAKSIKFLGWCSRKPKKSTAEKETGTNSVESTDVSAITTSAMNRQSSTASDPVRCVTTSGDSFRKRSTTRPRSSLSQKPLSLYPSTILGSAMVARGEIGFLISSIAQSSGVFETDTFLVVTWGIFLCTLVGPISVGLLVGRVKKLQVERNKAPGKQDPLGIWGVKRDPIPTC